MIILFILFIILILIQSIYPRRRMANKNARVNTKIMKNATLMKIANYAQLWKLCPIMKNATLNALRN